MLRLLALVLVAAAVLLGLPAPALANMAQPSGDGELSGVLEPLANASIRVDGETLTFDVAEGLETAAVKAVYRMTNTGAAATEPEVAFVFVDRGHVPANGAIQVDGAPVAIKVVSRSSRVSPGWSSLRGERPLTFLLFQIPFAPGQTRTVSVGYTQEASWNKSGRIHTAHTFDYLLSPAKSWASFGPLAISIKLPKDTRFSSPLGELKRDGDLWAGTLPTLPPGELSFEVMSSRGLWFGMATPSGYWAIYLVALAAVVLGIGAQTGKLWRRRPLGQEILLRLFVAGLLGAVGAALVTALELVTFPGHGLGYGGAIFGFLLILVSWPGCVLVSFLSAWVRGRPQAPPG